MNVLRRAIGRISYRYKIMLCYFLIISVPYSAGVVYLFNTMVKSTRTNTVYSVEQRMEQELAAVGRKLEAFRQTTYYFATNSSLNQFFTPNFHNDIQLVETMNNSIMPIMSWMEATAGGSGNFRFFTSLDQIPENQFFVRLGGLDGADWLPELAREVAQNGYAFEPAHPARSFRYSPAKTAGPVFSISYALPGVKPTTPTYLQMDILPRELFGSLNETPVLQSGFFSVVSGDGTDILGNLGGRGEADWAKESFISSREIPDIQCRLLCVIPLGEIEGPFNRAKRTFAGSVLLSTVLLLMLSSAVSGMLLKRIEHMRRAVHKMQQGDFQIHIPVHGSDEIDELAESMNIMSVKIGELINTVCRVQMRQKEAQLLALQAQINPHFLFNSLETFRMMAELENLEPLADGIASLGRLMRYSISMNQSSVTLQTELEIVGSYLKVQNLLHNGRIALSLEIPPGLSGLPMPALILQPLVENSVSHGIGNGKSALSVTIAAARAGDRVEIHVTDDGLGADVQRLRELEEMLAAAENSEFQSTKSIGLWNVNQRLILAYGEASALRLSSPDGGGFGVAFVIPAGGEGA